MWNVSNKNIDEQPIEYWFKVEALNPLSDKLYNFSRNLSFTKTFSTTTEKLQFLSSNYLNDDHY